MRRTTQISSIPELEVKAVQLAVFILLLIALAGLIIEAGFWLERKWMDEHTRTHATYHDLVRVPFTWLRIGKPATRDQRASPVFYNLRVCNATVGSKSHQPPQINAGISSTASRALAESLAKRPPCGWMRQASRRWMPHGSSLCVQKW
jgi:hypothetical protein